MPERHPGEFESGAKGVKPSLPAPSQTDLQSKPAGAFVIIAVKIAAWMNLVFCWMGSFYVFREMGVQLIEEEGFLDYSEKIISPFGVTLSMGLFLQGVFGCIFFLLLASIAENIMAMRIKIEEKGSEFRNSL